MPTPLILFLGLTVATCVIAYWSDNLGKKLGKKRISLFGLRPRQTATVITMASSWAIMVLTLVALLAVSPSLYNALMRFDRVNESNDKARELNAKLNENLTSLQGLQDRLKVQVQKSQAKVQETEQSRRLSETRLRTAQGKLRTAQRGESVAKRRAASAQQRSAGAQRRLAQAQRRFSAVQNQYTAARSRLQQNQIRLQQNEVSLRAINARLKSGNQRLAIANRDLKYAQGEYERAKQANRNLSESNKGLEAANERLVGQNLKASNELMQAGFDLTKANLDLKNARDKYEKLEIEIEALERQRDRIAQERTAWRQVTDELSLGKVSFRALQVLDERTIPANLGFTETQRQLTAIVERGREIVKATKTPDGTERSLEIILPVGEDMGVSEADIVRQASNYLGLLNGPASVRLVAAMNHAQIEPTIYANLRIVPIETKFVRDETITSGTVDGALGDAGIFNQLLALVNAGEAIAREQKGMDPIPTPENPFFYSTNTNERIFEALHKIQATGKKVQVRLVAAERLTTVDPLRIRFEIEDPST